MRGTAALFLFAALAAPLAADTVYLTNGKKFEEVVAERSAGEVRIRLPYGEILLPDRVVARVESSRSVWQEYGARELRLRRAGAPAGDWLALAVWAEESGYPEGMRRALVRAAELDPGLEGLAPLMARIGHVLDREAGEWLSEADYMRRRGYRLWGDHWLPREEFAARLRAREERHERRRQEAREERIARAIEALVVAELSRASQPPAVPEPPPAPRGPLVAVYSGGFLPWVPGLAVGAPPVAPPPPVDYEALARRQPGSLFPVPLLRRHLTSSE